MRRAKRLGWSAGILTLAVLATGACAGKKTGRVQDHVNVDVENHHWGTVVVYALTHGQRVRLGEVATGTRRNLKTPAGLSPEISNFRLHIDPVGSRQTYTTPNIPLGLGHTVHLRVENYLRHSTYIVN